MRFWSFLVLFCGVYILSRNAEGSTCCQNGEVYWNICYCHRYWTGPCCNVSSLNPCLNYCKNGGSCVVSYAGQATCSCLTGYSGNQCEISACIPSQCQNGGTCHLSKDPAGFYCDCVSPYYGNLCQNSAVCKLCNTLPPNICGTKCKCQANSDCKGFKCICP